MTVFFIVLAMGAFAWMAKHWSNRRHLQRLLSKPMSEDQRMIIEKQVPIASKLPMDLRSKLEGKINRFLDQVQFTGCNELEITEEMRVSIAAQACLLVVNTDTWYDNLTTVLVYPSAFKSKQTQHNGYVVIEREIVRTGESWSHGPVILSWSHSQQGAANDTDGHNVVFHEFAHQIDDLSGRTDGVPNLGPSQKFSDWARVFEAAYKKHVQLVQKGHPTVIDAYGAEGYEEFFAVSVEVFFEKPASLMREEPDVYEQLSMLFQLDPVTW
ncbi:M90 family metallopeptidase [uncultured Pelagimonas sp.]|uniref:M90 family metallopeptidase n=1 Tax=uncultured Pelagimonas sp. TaxID=1618102 RepID=UPI00262B0570|nr:M90 family metallopeptidase [uncultured Pelagimonas sp.]